MTRYLRGGRPALQPRTDRRRVMLVTAASIGDFLVREVGPKLGAVFTRIDHVGIAVRDLDEAIAFYRKAFDLELVHEEINEEQGVREAMLAVGDSGSSVQLLAPLTESSPIAKFLADRGEGVQQVAYTVEDIDATCRTLRSRGMRLLYEQPRRGTAGSRVNFIHPKDAGGVLVELVEPADPQSPASPSSRGRSRPDLRNQ